MTDTITITELADVRVGDWVVAEYGSDRHRFEGEAYAGGDYGCLGTPLWVAGLRIRHAEGHVGAHFVEARRAKPGLPTNLSLIRATVDGETIFVFGPDADDEWANIDASGHLQWLAPVAISDFEVLWTEAV